VALYVFDTRDNDAVVADDVGLDLPHIDAAKVQAAKSLADLRSMCFRAVLGAHSTSMCGAPKGSLS
jgi:hypothetical protein